MILAVDLAAKFSAWGVTDKTGKVHAQGDSRDQSKIEFALTLANVAEEWSVSMIILEDVPYGIKGQFQTKPVIRLQGSIFLALYLKYYGFLEKTYLINPATWQRNYPGVARGEESKRIEAARVAAESLGYSPPDLIGEYAATLSEGAKLLKKNTNPLAKVMTDYVDMFLISDFYWTHQDTFTELSGVQPA